MPKMTIQEEDKLLHETEIMFMRRKVACKTGKKQKMYGIGANAVHRERAFWLKDVDKNLGFSRCICGEIVRLEETPFYCSKCGQKLSTEWGWTIDDYYNEKKTGAI